MGEVGEIGVLSSTSFGRVSDCRAGRVWKAKMERFSSLEWTRSRIVSQAVRRLARHRVPALAVNVREAAARQNQ